MTCQLTGIPEKGNFLILYDRDYVLAWLDSQLLSKLASLSKQDIIQLIDDAWELAEKKQLRLSMPTTTKTAV